MKTVFLICLFCFCLYATECSYIVSNVVVRANIYDRNMDRVDYQKYFWNVEEPMELFVIMNQWMVWGGVLTGIIVSLTLSGHRKWLFAASYIALFGFNTFSMHVGW